LNIVNKIIERAYKNAVRIPLKKNSRIIFFSDLHKGDFSHSDDFKKNLKIYLHALTDYYNTGFTYIELGDGTELWENKSFAPIYKAYKSVFDLLKCFYQKERLHLIWGNHDMEFRDPIQVEKIMYSIYTPKSIKAKKLHFNLKFIESLLLEIENTDKNIFVLHGHQADYMNYVHWKFHRFFVRYFWNYMQKWFGINDPTSPARNFKGLIKVEKRLNKWIVKNNDQMIIFGHTHRPRFPDPGNLPLFNDGSCVHPGSITGIEIVDEKISLVKWYEETGNNNKKEIVKIYLEEPVSLFKFL
jgi:predicted phosphodiesterase